MQDNQVITAENLNNIAIDLGSPTFSYFTDGTPYAINELNSITSDLVTAGILNTMENCECVLNSDNTVTVKTGIIVFNDGCKIRITEEKTLAITDISVKNYIFAEHSKETDIITLKIDTALPNEANYVILCEVENNTLTDKRVMSKAKYETITANPTWNATQVVQLNETITTSPQQRTFTVEIPVDGDNFNYIILPFNNNCMACYDIKNGVGSCCYRAYDREFETVQGNIIYKSDTDNLNYYIREEIRFISIVSGKLSLDIYWDFYQYSSQNETATGTFTQQFILC